jgi:hypothetical protein
MPNHSTTDASATAPVKRRILAWFMITLLEAPHAVPPNVRHKRAAKADPLDGDVIRSRI